MAKNIDSKTEVCITSRELEVVQYVSLGYTYREIGTKLHVSPETIKSHVSKLRTKLGAKNNPHLVRICLEQDLLH